VSCSPRVATKFELGPEAARQCAQQAHLQAAERTDQAAKAHLRRAVLYEAGNSERAQAHREAALAKRAPDVCGHADSVA
jgi:hypothetical protein